MKSSATFRRRNRVFLPLILTLLVGQISAQSNSSSQRTFPQSKDSIEKALKKLQPSMAGRLPVVEGFVASADQPLDRYHRAYYQTSVQVTGNSPKDCVVRATTKITAWYTDPAGVHSGYRLLNSNGRLESDLLDQLADEVAANMNPAPAPSPAPATESTRHAAPAQNQAADPSIAAVHPHAPGGADLGAVQQFLRADVCSVQGLDREGTKEAAALDGGPPAGS